MKGISRDTLFFLTGTLLMSIPASYEPHHFAKALLLGAIIQSAAYSVVFIWMTRKWTLLRHVIWVLLLLLFLVETYTFFAFGSRLNPAILTLILQTSWNETTEFFTTYFCSLPTLLFLAAGICCALAYFWLQHRCRHSSNRSKLQLGCEAAVVISGLALFFVPMPFPLGNNTLNEIGLSASFVNNKRQEVETMKAMIDRIVITDQPADSCASPTIVLVIGESFNKHHSNLYDYDLPTSPLLAAERDSGNLIVFNHAYTPTNGTPFAMRYLFTQKGCEDADADSVGCILMPAVFRKANYEVAYFDNQYTRASGGALDYSCVYFLNPQYIHQHCFDYRNTETADYDADFVQQHASHFRHTARSLNIIHLMGQHFDASQRYPSDFAVFSANDISKPDLDEHMKRQVAAYDNATLYNDYTLKTIIELFEKDDAIIVYLSDHGEQIYDGPEHYFGRSFGSEHDATTLRNVFEIPMTVWCSKKYQQQHAAMVHRLRSSADKTICLADIPYALYELAGIEFNYNIPSRSFLSNDYRGHHSSIH